MAINEVCIKYKNHQNFLPVEKSITKRKITAEWKSKGAEVSWTILEIWRIKKTLKKIKKMSLINQKLGNNQTDKTIYSQIRTYSHTSFECRGRFLKLWASCWTSALSHIGYSNHMTFKKKNHRYTFYFHHFQFKVPPLTPHLYLIFYTLKQIIWPNNKN